MLIITDSMIEKALVDFIEAMGSNVLYTPGKGVIQVDDETGSTESDIESDPIMQGQLQGLLRLTHADLLLAHLARRLPRGPSSEEVLKGQLENLVRSQVKEVDDQKLSDWSSRCAYALVDHFGKEE